MANPRQPKTGMATSPGSERTFGIWLDRLDSYPPNSLPQAAGRVLDGVYSTGLRLNNQNRAIAERRTDYPIPEPDMRLRLARDEQKKLAALKENLEKVKRDAVVKQHSLSPFDYASTGPYTSPSDSLQGRAEIRRAFAVLDANGRKTALQDARVRKAVVEGPGFMSGLSDIEQQNIWDNELELKFAPELQELRDADYAIAQVETSIKAVEEAVERELKAIGQPVVETTPKAPSKEWA
jgi:hypothetical protein